MSLYEQQTSKNITVATLNKLSEALVDARQLLVSQEYTPGRGGKRVKSASRAIGRYCYRLFDEFTGRPPTIHTRDGKASGPFLDFITDVFLVMGVDASPEAVGRKVCKEKARAKSDQTP